MTRILGIDPGSRITGYGVIQVAGSDIVYVASGVIKTQLSDFSSRLHDIFTGVCEVITAYKPHCAAIEQVFMHVNPQAALKLGHARGAALVGMHHMQLAVAEYTARQVKQAVVGYGNAEKSQVQNMVTRLLNLSEQPVSDAADALAIAMCHYQCAQSSKLNKVLT